jgi:4-hydroxy 2-oxovalerate aldolase
MALGPGASGGMKFAHLRLLDCTIRDGGFYNEWDFSPAFVGAYLRAVEYAGVDCIEIGYRSRQMKGFAGAYKYSEEALLRRLRGPGTPELAVMIDAKEFEGIEDQVTKWFLPKAESVVSLVRLATTHTTMPTTLKQVEMLHKLGYRTTINLMAYGALDTKARRASISAMAQSPTDVAYLADSFGSMIPEDVDAAADLLGELSDKPWGLHLHNNQELAFANAIVAVQRGATWIDSSVMGMGRGPGNLRTELIAQYLNARLGLSRYHAEPVIEFIEREMTALHAHYQWGPGSAYVLSGSLGVHPTYVQTLIGTGRYRATEVVEILRRIYSSGQGTGFKREVLDAAISSRSRGDGSAVAAGKVTARIADWSDRDVLIVGRGESVTTHAAAVNEYIRRYQPVVIECNETSDVAAASDHYCAFIVSANAVALAPQALKAGKKVVVGVPLAEREAWAADPDAVATLPYQIQSGTLDVQNMTIPYDVVSMYAIALALRNGARRICAVGFDGYAGSLEGRDVRMQSEMEQFIGLLRTKHPSLQLRSLLPSSYDLEIESIYGLLAAPV